jgi:hypothetical protein
LELLEEHKFTDLPLNRGQALALYDVKGIEERVAAWDSVIKSGQKITAALITQLGDQSPTPEPESTVLPVTQPVVAQKKSRKKTTCSAKLQVALDSSVLQDAAEYNGIKCDEVSPGIYEFSVVTEDKPSLFRELASWSRVYDVTKITIDFDK